MSAAPPPGSPSIAPQPLPGGAAPAHVDAAEPEAVALTDFAGARIACPVCGTRIEATRGHCFGCGWVVATPAPQLEMETVRRSARAIYLLMALSLFVAVPAIGALILAYADRGKARGSWLDSHYEWQVDTLWGVFWTGVAVLMATWLGSRFLGTGPWMLLTGLPALAWYVHRIVKGWTRLGDGEPITEL